MRQLIRGIEIVVGFGQVAFVLPGHAAIVEARAASRIEFDRQIVICNRVVVVVLVVPSDAAVEIDLPQPGVVLLVFERFGEVCDRAVIVAGLVAGHAAVVEAVAAIGAELDRGAVVGDRARVIGVAIIGRATLIVDVGAIRRRQRPIVERARVEVYRPAPILFLCGLVRGMHVG